MKNEAIYGASQRKFCGVFCFAKIIRIKESVYHDSTY